MINATEDLVQETLQQNFAYWISKLNWIIPAHASSEAHTARIIPTTHTFGYYKRWGDGPENERYIYEVILLKDKALLSDQYRNDQGMFSPGELRATMERAREVNLHHFVFTYLGVHDPYYTRGKALAIPGFGVFIRTDSELFPVCNSTRRDLSSPEAEYPPDHEFLLPTDARRLAHLQASNDARHRNDFWHYWGSPLYISQPGYRRDQWQWKIEMHFREKIGIENFDAILWPFQLKALRARKREVQMLGDVESFRALFPNCKIIPYNWKHGGHSLSLIRASYEVMRYYIAIGKYPDDVL